MGRTIALGAGLAFVGLLAFLTVSVAVDHGIDVLVVVSLVVLAMLAIALYGALTTPPEE